MARWADFERGAPELAAAGRALLYQYGPGLGFLGTVRRDGGPRLHPICPAVVDGGLYALIGRSPKRADLLRDGRYALHTFPPRDVDDEFYVTGRAQRIDDPERFAAVLAAQKAVGVNTGPDELLFELDVERVMHAKYGPRPSWPPHYIKWKAP